MSLCVMHTQVLCCGVVCGIENGSAGDSFICLFFTLSSSHYENLCHLLASPLLAIEFYNESGVSCFDDECVKHQILFILERNCLCILIGMN